MFLTITSLLTVCLIKLCTPGLQAAVPGTDDPSWSALSVCLSVTHPHLAAPLDSFNLDMREEPALLSSTSSFLCGKGHTQPATLTTNYQTAISDPYDAWGFSVSPWFEAFCCLSLSFLWFFSFKGLLPNLKLSFHNILQILQIIFPNDFWCFSLAGSIRPSMSALCLSLNSLFDHVWALHTFFFYWFYHSLPFWSRSMMASADMQQCMPQHGHGLMPLRNNAHL